MNEHIESYLDYYIDLKVPPEFAVLLRGNWGSGKTWFIKDYLKRKGTVEHLYVSLNGVSSFEQIEDIFFQQLHPFLASKGMKIAGKIFRGVLKTTIKVDLNDDNKEDGSISSSVPDIDLPKYLKNLDSKILVFDDLERCAISIPVILGYINQFVEINGQKVIVLANESEIIKRDNGKQDVDAIKYLTIKEKVIGRSFNVHSNLKDAIQSFISQVSDKSNKALIQEVTPIILSQFELSEYGNLRHLRQSILDFDRFLHLLPDEVGDKSDLIIQIVELFFSISFEIKKGNISESDIPKLFLIDYLAQSKGAEKTIPQQIRSKYSVFNQYHQPIDYSLLEAFFKYGTVDKERLRSSILSSSYFIKENTPNWIKLWYYFELNDDEFERISASVISSFDNLQITDKDELIQVVGILLNLSDQKLIPTIKPKIVKRGKENIDNLLAKNLLQTRVHEEFPKLDTNGLTTYAANSNEFREVFSYAREKSQIALDNNYTQEALVLLERLPKSVWEFREYITLGNSRNNHYYNIPILKYIPVEKFISTFLQLSNKNKRDLNPVFRERYRHIKEFPSLLEEIDWLVSLYKGLEAEKKQYEKKVSGMMIDLMLSTIKNIVENLQIESTLP